MSLRGRLFGVLAAAAPLACASAPAASPAPACSGFTPPLRISQGPSTLPDSFLAARVGGEVVDEVVIRKDGAVGAVRPTRSRIAELAPYAEASVRRSRFSPASIEGNPVADADSRHDSRGARAPGPVRAGARLALGVHSRRRIERGALAARGQRREAGDRRARRGGDSRGNPHRGGRARRRRTDPLEGSPSPAAPPKSGKPSRPAASSRGRETTGWSCARAAASSPRPPSPSRPTSRRRSSTPASLSSPANGDQTRTALCSRRRVERRSKNWAGAPGPGPHAIPLSRTLP